MAGVSDSGMTSSGADLWKRLRRFTPARIGLGRAGASLPTHALLDFELAHAQARDAVHAELDVETLALELCENGFSDPQIVKSQARDRMEFLLRPDLGRTLDEESRERLRPTTAHSDGISGAETRDRSLAIVIADGLSALAATRHAVPLMKELRAAVEPGEPVPVVIATGARVALGDQIGELLAAEAVVVLIGERPGLSSPDSLGAYLTWSPQTGRTDAERNCVSNIRPEGLPYADAARKLLYLLSEARRLQLSGVALKDDSEPPSPALP